MKRYLHAFVMCQSMFCAIPFPSKLWDEQAKDKMLLFLPVIGLEIGALWAGLGCLCSYFGVPTPMAALLLTALPYVATGGMHLDGFMDVTDAVRSWRDVERRREILKDSHVGSFAVIAVVFLILGQFACFLSTDVPSGVLFLIPALSRCGSALAVTGLRSMAQSQYAAQKKPRSHLFVFAATAALLTALGFALFGKYGFALLGCAVGYALALLRAYRSLQGMNGDIAGYALSIGELCAVAVCALL